MLSPIAGMAMVPSALLDSAPRASAGAEMGLGSATASTTAGATVVVSCTVVVVSATVVGGIVVGATVVVVVSAGAIWVRGVLLPHALASAAMAASA